METISGVIQKKDISSGVDKNNKPYTRWVFELNDGKKYSTFNKDIGEKFNVADSVKMTGQMRGQYWTMETMELSDLPQQPQENNEVVDLLRQILVELKIRHEPAV
jgi:hypothetical protein